MAQTAPSAERQPKIDVRSTTYAPVRWYYEGRRSKTFFQMFVEWWYTNFAQEDLSGWPTRDAAAPEEEC